MDFYIDFYGMIRAFIDLFYFLLSLAVDVVVFVKLAQPIKTGKDKLFLVLFCLIMSVILVFSPSDFVNTWLTYAEIAVLYLYFAIIRKNNHKLILGSLLFFCVIDQFLLASEFLIGSFIAFLKLHIWEEAFDILLSLITMVIVTKYSRFLRERLIDQNSNIFIGILFYIYLSCDVINYYLGIDKRPIEVIQISIGLLIFQTIFAILIYIGMVHTQRNLLNHQEQKAEFEKQQQLEDYATYLEKSKDELRSFRHDYRNMFESLKLSAKEGNVDEVIEKLDQYTKTNLNSQAFLKYKDINHVHLKIIKSIIISKLTEMYNLRIKYNFECRQEITKLPQNLDALDLVRIIGITCDNAIEESKLLKKRGLTPEIQIMFYSEGNNEFEYEIRNRTVQSKISIKKIQEQGYTTKKNHAGLGLANIAKIEDKYAEMSISYNVKDNWFDFYLVIDTEGD